MTNWAVAVWASITPDLEGLIELDIREAEAALRPIDDLNVDVYTQQGRKGPVLRYAWRGGRRVANRQMGAIDLKKALKRPDSCWHAAEHRLLVLWGHGSRAFPAGASRPDLLEVPDGAEVARIFSGGGLPKPSIVGYDACRMASVETVVALAAELENAIFVGSMVPEPGSGWPYFESLQMLTGPWSDEPRAVASGLVEAYAAAVDTKDWCMIALDLSRVAKLRTAWKKLLAAPVPSDEVFFAAAAGADIPDDTDLADLGALVRRLEDHVGRSSKEVHKRLLEALIARRAGGGLVGRDGLAVSIALPPDLKGHTWRRFMPLFGDG